MPSSLETLMFAATMAFSVALIVMEAVLVSLATNAVVTAWFKENGPFTLWRAYTEAVGGWVSVIFGCPVCLSYHVALILVILLVLPALLWPAALWLQLPLLWLAAVGLHNRE